MGPEFNYFTVACSKKADKNLRDKGITVERIKYEKISPLKRSQYNRTGKKVEGVPMRR